jgi:hypothetical protein
MSPAGDSGSKVESRASILTTFVTPMILAATGTLYLTGYLLRSRVYSDMGVTGEALTTSFQATLALGYSALFFYLLIAGGLALISYAIFVLFIEPKFAMLSVPTAWKRTLVGYLIFIFMGVGVYTGTTQGEAVAEKVRQSVANGCQSECFIYQVRSRQYLGRVVGADPERIMIRTRKGTRIFNLSDVRVVVPYRPGMVLPQIEAEDAVAKPS